MKKVQQYQKQKTKTWGALVMNKEAKVFVAISKWNKPPIVQAAQKYQKFLIESGMNVKNSFMRNTEKKCLGLAKVGIFLRRNIVGAERK